MDTSQPPPQPSLEGWDINHADQLEWVPWGEGGARAKILGTADGYVVAYVEAEPGYRGTPHEHANVRVLLPRRRRGHESGPDNDDRRRIRGRRRLATRRLPCRRTGALHQHLQALT